MKEYELLAEGYAHGVTLSKMGSQGRLVKDSYIAGFLQACEMHLLRAKEIGMKEVTLYSDLAKHEIRNVANKESLF
jgi:hypothetical protein